jgi:hypothetical protein
MGGMGYSEPRGKKKYLLPLDFIFFHSLSSRISYAPRTRKEENHFFTQTHYTKIKDILFAKRMFKNIA